MRCTTPSQAAPRPSKNAVISLKKKHSKRLSWVFRDADIEATTRADQETAGSRGRETAPVGQARRQAPQPMHSDLSTCAFPACRERAPVGQLSRQAVDGKAAYKLTFTDEAGNVTTAFIDKESCLTVKTVAKVEQMGQEMEVESYVKEYMDVNGAKFSKVIKQFVNGMEMGGMTFTKIELDREIDDSVFVMQ